MKRPMGMKRSAGHEAPPEQRHDAEHRELCRPHLRQGYGGHATAQAMTWREITGFRVLPMRPMRPIGPIVRGGQPETQDHFSVFSFAKNHRRCYIIILSLNWI